MAIHSPPLGQPLPADGKINLKDSVAPTRREAMVTSHNLQAVMGVEMAPTKVGGTNPLEGLATLEMVLAHTHSRRDVFRRAAYFVKILFYFS